MSMHGILFCSAASIAVIQTLLFVADLPLSTQICLIAVEVMNGVIAGSAIARIGLGSMTKFAVVLWEDRHAEPTPYLFSDTATAVRWAKAQAQAHTCCDEFEEFAGHGDTVYAATYCIEGDHISVVECLVDAEVEVP